MCIVVRLRKRSCITFGGGNKGDQPVAKDALKIILGEEYDFVMQDKDVDRVAARVKSN